MVARAAAALLRLSLLQLLARAHAGATAEALLAEGRLRHGNGERGRFALSTGAWFISPEEKLRRTQNCSLARKEHCTYKLDLGLARCLSRFFAGSTVTELGAGVGRYAQFIGGYNDTAVKAYVRRSRAWIPTSSLSVRLLLTRSGPRRDRTACPTSRRRRRGASATAT